MPVITPIGVDLPVGAVTQAWYAEASSTITLSGAYTTVIELTVTVPAGAALLHLFAADVRRTSQEVTGNGTARLSAGSNMTPAYDIGSIYQGSHRHNFVQHLWLNLPSGSHTFRAEMARASNAGLTVHNRMMALLLLKR